MQTLPAIVARILVLAAVLGIDASLWAAQAVAQLDLGGGVKLELIRISRGTFQQGSPITESKRSTNEAPRQVTLNQDYHLGKTAVTVGQFQAFVAETHYRTDAERGTSGGFGWNGSNLVQHRQFTWKDPGFPQTRQHPATIISYDDALAFCAWATRKTGCKVTLPSEAEWEYGCRAGTITAWHNSSNEEIRASEIALFRSALHGTEPVTARKANAWGLHICGNVFEWCRDWFAPYPSGPVSDPEQTAIPPGTDKPRRVLRGGSWLKEAYHTRSASRYMNTPGSRNADNGFRVMTLSLPAKSTTDDKLQLEYPDARPSQKKP